MCVTVLGHRDGCYAGKVCSFFLHYLSKRRYLLRVCHACSFSRKTIDIEKCVYKFVTTVISWWNIASCFIWTGMINGRWQARWSFSVDNYSKYFHMLIFLPFLKVDLSKLLLSIVWRMKLLDTRAWVSARFVWKYDACKWLVFQFGTSHVNYTRLSSQWCSTQWHSSFISHCLWYKSNTRSSAYHCTTPHPDRWTNTITDTLAL